MPPLRFGLRHTSILFSLKKPGEGNKLSRSGFAFALGQEAVLGGSGQRFAVAVYGLWLTSVALAFLQKACLGSANEWLSILADGLAFTGLLCARRGNREGRQDEGKEQAFHL
jgi:hypothetical protein